MHTKKKENPFHSEFIDEAVLLLMLLNCTIGYLYFEMESMHKVLLLHTKLWWLIWQKGFVQLFELHAKLAAFFHWNTIFVHKNGYQTIALFKIGHLTAMFLKVNKVCHFKGKAWLYLLPVIKFEPSSKN